MSNKYSYMYVIKTAKVLLNEAINHVSRDLVLCN